MKEMQELIREKAAALWNEAGCPNSMDVVFWLRAEEIVKNERKGCKWCFYPDGPGFFWKELNEFDKKEISYTYPNLDSFEKYKWRKQ